MLTISTLQKRNAARLPLFKNARGEFSHSKPDGSDWSLYDWFCALIGEVGEFANLWKKVRRGDITIEEVRDELGNELADVVCYLVILLTRMGVDDPDGRYGSKIVGGDADKVETLPAVGVADLIRDLSVLEWFVRRMSDDAYTGMVPDTTAINPLVTIDRIAHSLEIDLSEAVVRKFNLVSDRVGCDIYL